MIERNLEPLRILLQKFVDGENRSLSSAGKIESELIKMFPEDEDLEDFEFALATYHPRGGEFLCDDETIVHWCKWMLAKIETLRASD